MKNLFTLLFVTLLTVNSFAQLKFGADISSRNVWRGTDYSKSPVIQPSLTYTTGGLSIGAWASYAFPTEGYTYSENDLWASYSVSTKESGSFSVVVTDYYFPTAGIPFGNYKPKPGFKAAHTIEGGLAYSGPESFPISLAFYNILSNDVDNSTYIQASYPVTVGDASLTFGAGFVPSASAFYATDKANFINLSVTAKKSIIITEKFSLPIKVSYIANPALDKTYLVFGASFTF